MSDDVTIDQEDDREQQDCADRRIKLRAEQEQGQSEDREDERVEGTAPTMRLAFLRLSPRFASSSCSAHLLALLAAHHLVRADDLLAELQRVPTLGTDRRSSWRARSVATRS
jgi:hypothetical protein